jgi:DNA polymerase-3 subunit delta'
MSFKDILGHERPIRLLQRGIAGGKVAHSYLFLGAEGIGKSLVALQFAKALNCLEGADTVDACDRCISCKKINRLVHPDVSIIEPQGQTLKVDQVREMQKALAYRPYEGRCRVFILTAADRMAPHMSNTLLKTLEEPPPQTVIILQANHPRWILPTILSRCQPIRFNPLPSHLVSHWLIKAKGLGEREAHLLATLSEGSPGKALEIKEEIAGIPRKELLEGWMGSGSLSMEEKEDWIDSLPSQRENLNLILELAKTLLRDLIVVKTSGEASGLIHADLAEEMEKVAGQWDLSSLLKRMENLHQTARAIKGNANTRLSLEAMMLSWA